MDRAALDIATLRELIVPIKGYDELRRRLLSGELERFRKSLEWVEACDRGSLLEVGARGDLVPVYKQTLGFDRVVCLDAAGSDGSRRIEHESGNIDEYESRRVDLERQPFPLEDESFDQAVVMEVLEHMAIDPMFMLAEVNRVLKPGGSLLLTTPNTTSLGALYKMIWGKHPAIGDQTYGPGIMDRHHREYAPGEVSEVLAAAGFEVQELDTFDPSPPSPSAKKAKSLLRLLHWFKPGIDLDHRGRVIRCRCVKVGKVAERFPKVIYPRYAYYDYAAYDRELTRRFHGHRYWRTDAVSVDARAPQAGEPNEPAPAVADKPVLTPERATPQPLDVGP